MNAKRTPTKRKRIPIFYPIYFGLILIFLVALVIANLFLGKILGEYESVQAKYEAQQVFDTYFSDFSYRDMTEYFDVSAFLTESGYETQEELFDALDKLTEGGEMTFYQSADNGDGRIEYAVSVNRMRVAVFSLIPDTAETTEHGFTHYKLDTIRLYNPIRASIITSDETNPPTFLYTYTIHAPLSHTVTANGTVLGKDQQKGEIVYDTEAMSAAKSGFAGIPTVTYELILEEPPVLTAVDLNGDTVAPAFDEERLVYTYPITFSRAVLDTHSDYVIEVCQKLGIYMQAGAYFSSVEGYYDPTTQLYQDVKRIGGDAWMIYKFDSCEFEEIKVREAYAYSDTEFSIRVSMIQIGHRSGKPDSVDHLDYTFCFHLVEGSWLIFESYNN